MFVFVTEKGVFVTDQQRLDAKIWTPGAPGFNFRIEVFGLCKRDETSRDLIQSRAILLSVILRNGQLRVLKYLQVAVTDEGQVALPFGGRHHGFRFPLRYNKVQLRTDDVRESRELYATYLRPRTNDEETIDERYFEVIRQRSGTYRIKTVINPNLYLAVINVRGRLMFVVTTYDARLPRNVADYDFNIDVPVTRVNNCARPQPPRQETTSRVSSPTRREHQVYNRNRGFRY
ncbi:uncharacterized protein [Watersipora subatra]|uniref:uncharacterized protein n=1 Tax=Watersipora subatra TaxID=2589382 RepID=UPI00355ADA0F